MDEALAIIDYALVGRLARNYTSKVGSSCHLTDSSVVLSYVA